MELLLLWLLAKIAAALAGGVYGYLLAKLMLRLLRRV